MDAAWTDVGRPRSPTARAAPPRFGRVDTIVTTAAGNFLVPAEDLRPKGFRTVIEIDTIGSRAPAAHGAAAAPAVPADRRSASSRPARAGPWGTRRVQHVQRGV